MIKTYVAFDLETAGLSEENDQIIEIGAVKVQEGKVTDRFMQFLRPDEPISPAITYITGITNEMVANARNTETVVQEFVQFCDGYMMLGHNIMFDYKFMKRYAGKYGLPFEREGLDTLKIARKVHKDLKSKSLESLCSYYEIINEAAHRAYHDALATAKIYHMMAHYYEEKYPAAFAPESLLYKPKKVQPATEKQKNFLQALILCHNLDVQADYDHLTRSEASKIIDGIILKHGNLKR